jgi:hypothetical protein
MSKGRGWSTTVWALDTPFPNQIFEMSTTLSSSKPVCTFFPLTVSAHAFLFSPLQFPPLIVSSFFLLFLRLVHIYIYIFVHTLIILVIEHIQNLKGQCHQKCVQVRPTDKWFNILLHLGCSGMIIWSLRSRSKNREKLSSGSMTYIRWSLPLNCRRNPYIFFVLADFRPELLTKTAIFLYHHRKAGAQSAAV